MVHPRKWNIQVMAEGSGARRHEWKDMRNVGGPCPWGLKSQELGKDREEMTVVSHTPDLQRMRVSMEDIR